MAATAPPSGGTVQLWTVIIIIIIILVTAAIAFLGKYNLVPQIPQGIGWLNS